MIYDSRNSLTAKALVNGYDLVLWLGSDMMLEPDLLERLSEKRIKHDECIGTERSAGRNTG